MPKRASPKPPKPLEPDSPKQLVQDYVDSLLQEGANELGIKAGQTTADMKFSLEVVACVGACAMAPVVIVNEKYHGGVKVSQAKKLVKG